MNNDPIIGMYGKKVEPDKYSLGNMLSESSKTRRSILMFGMPGAGKGTQAELLADHPLYHHFSTGMMFRYIANHGVPNDVTNINPEELVEIMASGGLVPDNMTVELFKYFINKDVEGGLYDPSSQFLIADGIPRTVAQAKMLVDYLFVEQIVYLTLPEELAINRISERAKRLGRVDDANKDTIRERLKVFEEETNPVLSFYDPTIIAKINGEGTVSEVQKRILERIIFE